MLGDPSPVLQHRDMCSSAVFCRFSRGQYIFSKFHLGSASFSRPQASLQRGDGALNSLVPSCHAIQLSHQRVLRPPTAACGARERHFHTPTKSHRHDQPERTFSIAPQTHACMDLRLFHFSIVDCKSRPLDRVDYDCSILCDHCFLLMSCK